MTDENITFEITELPSFSIEKKIEMLLPIKLIDINLNTEYTNQIVYKNNQYKDIVDINIKKAKIMINFTSLFDKKFKVDKEYQEIVVHTPSIEKMDDFVKGFKILLKTIGLSMGTKPLEYKQASKQPNWDEQLEYRFMPSFESNQKQYECATITISIERCDTEKRKKFIKNMIDVFEIKITESTTSVWFPERPIELSPYKSKMWVCPETLKNKYPIYVISLGRYEKRTTQRYLEWCGLDYKVVVEPFEYDEYAKVIPIEKLLVCPENYSKTLKSGGIPVRNFVWRHSISIGAKRHWILDDNIISYKRCSNGERTLVKGGVVFRAIEDFCDRFTNIKMSGHNYTMFGIASNTKLKPVVYNSRIYSSILLSNDLITDNLIAEGWRGKWNEDTDLSLRVMEAGFPTALFNNFLAEKVRTMAQKGGNTDTIYSQPNAHLQKAQYLVDMFPHLAKVNHRFSRTHHYVDYSSFKHLKPIYKDGEADNYIEGETFEYGMSLNPLDTTWRAPVIRGKKQTKINEVINDEIDEDEDDEETELLDEN